jgi:hypothetical protein
MTIQPSAFDRRVFLSGVAADFRVSDGRFGSVHSGDFRSQELEGIEIR